MTTHFEDQYNGTQSQPSQSATPQELNLLGRLLSLNVKFPTLELRNGELKIGRRADVCDVVCNEPQVSSIHCILYPPPLPTKFGFMIKDLSSNGTFVNGGKIGEGGTRILKNMDHLSIVTSKTKTDRFMSYIFQDLREEVNTNQNTDEIFQYYDIHKELGKGNFSVVHLGINKSTGEACAIKFLNKRKFWSDPKIKDQVVREVEILRQIKHPNVVQYKDLYEGDTYVYLVLEYAEGGELFHKIRTGVSESEARTLFTQLLKAVNYLHDQSIVHRDLKPENILLDGQGNIKISDFGLARFDATHMQSLCGTPHYVAPEVIRLGLGNSSVGYGKEVDMWSLGVSLYHMLTGYLPFTETDRMALFNQIEKGAYDFPHQLWITITVEAKDLVKKLLDIDPKTRLSAEQALKHPWIARSGGAYVNSRALQTSHLSNRKRTSEMVICNNSDSISKPDTAGRKKMRQIRMSTVL
jgi:serine/threonine-protein kinase Chk2